MTLFATEHVARAPHYYVDTGSNPEAEPRLPSTSYLPAVPLVVDDRWKVHPRWPIFDSNLEDHKAETPISLYSTAPERGSFHETIDRVGLVRAWADRRKGGLPI